MKIHPTRRLVAALTGSVLLVLPACGGAQDTADGEAAAAPSASPSPQESMDHSMPDATTPMGNAADGDPFGLTRQAASHMPMTADALARGFDAALDFPGAAMSDAADLRAALTYLLTEHVYLAGIAVDTAYVAGPKSQEFKLAAGALDENTVALADAVGSVAGRDNRRTFLQAWRSHIDDFVTYAVAVKSNDQAGKQQALKDLEGYQRVAGQFFEEVTGGALPASAVRASLDEHVKTLTAAIDAFAAGDAHAFDKLKAAAGHMPMTAQALATGIDQATGMKGDPNSQASQVRALLNAELTEHVYLAGTGVFTAYVEGADSDAFKAAAAALDANSVELSKAVTSLTDKKTGDNFLQAWRSHIDDFVTYAVAVAEDDQQAKQMAEANLQAYAVQQGKTMQELTGGALQADVVQQAFETHIATLTAAIDAMAAALV
ncbi:MAG TPA: hypothetical protein VHG70_15710 [Nocardioidaceae bacterium]|nr:hypothetical protein [Nocardioidaceae bacterium]